MTDHPILFSAPMIRALLDGRKTMTRRPTIETAPLPPIVGRNYPYQPRLGPHGPYWCWLVGERPEAPLFRPTRWAIGDRLWVKEAWRTGEVLDPYAPRELDPSEADIWYQADPKPDGLWGRYRNARFMPRWASRITLRVTGLRVERVQEIAEADARREGVLYVPGHGDITLADLKVDPGYSNYLNCRMGFEVLWNTIHGPYAWAANDWVSVTSFERIEG